MTDQEQILREYLYTNEAKNLLSASIRELIFILGDPIFSFRAYYDPEMGDPQVILHVGHPEMDFMELLNKLGEFRDNWWLDHGCRQSTLLVMPMSTM